MHPPGYVQPFMDILVERCTFFLTLHGGTYLKSPFTTSTTLSAQKSMTSSKKSCYKNSKKNHHHQKNAKTSNTLTVKKRKFSIKNQNLNYFQRAHHPTPQLPPLFRLQTLLFSRRCNLRHEKELHNRCGTYGFPLLRTLAVSSRQR